jgi:predicted dehydrogenase
MKRYGILGFGHHAAKRMVPGFAGARNSQLTGIWRRNLQKASTNAAEFGIPQVFATAEALCASPEIDAVFIASPDSMHLHDGLLALRHGKPVLCEKPLAMNAAEVEQLLTASKRAGVPFGVAQNMRYESSTRLVRQWITDGKIGKPLLAHAQFCYSAEKSPRDWIYDPALALGGPIGDVGIHCIDGLRFVLSSDVEDVVTVARRDEGSGEVESFGIFAVNFACGALGSVSVTTRGAYRSLIEVTGETGVLRCEDGLTVDHDVSVELIRDGQIVESRQVSNADCYSQMVDGFTDAIEGRGMFLAPVEDGLHNQHIMDAVYRSWRTGVRQLIPPSITRELPAPDRR